jgi:hypothetical protein
MPYSQIGVEFIMGKKSKEKDQKVKKIKDYDARLS